VEQLDDLLAIRFPGGTTVIEHWENWLLTDCTGRAPMTGGVVHPVAMFHVPIRGVGTSITELFEAFGTVAGDGRVALLGYNWVYDEPLREDVPYDVRGGVTNAVRHTGDDGAVGDEVSFTIELHAGGRRVAQATDCWYVHRSGRPTVTPESTGTSGGGESLPPWEVASVDPARMKTMAAVLRDPYPLHWDRDLNERIGFGRRTINQGPLNLSYIANMLMAWAGDGAVRRLDVRFGRPVFDGDRVVARGRVLRRVGGVAHCEVWLDRDGERVVDGVAEVSSGSVASRAQVAPDS
jgi:acyl dehydratase